MQETCFWVCLWGCCQRGVTDGRKIALNPHFMGWEYGWNKKKQEKGSRAPAPTSFCFLVLPKCEHAASSSCHDTHSCHSNSAFSGMIEYSLTLWTKINLFSIMLNLARNLNIEMRKLTNTIGTYLLYTCNAYICIYTYKYIYIYEWLIKKQRVQQFSLLICLQHLKLLSSHRT